MAKGPESGVGPFALLVASPAAPPALPFADWQFWVVTVVALLAAGWIVRRMIPKRLLGKPRRGAAKRATLTIAGRAVDPVRPAGKGDCH